LNELLKTILSTRPGSNKKSDSFEPLLYPNSIKD